MKNTYKISELSTLLKRGITPSYTETPKVMVINQKCIRDYKLNLDLARYTDPEKRKITDEKYLKSFDVLVNSTGVGTLGRVAQISEVNGPVTSDSHVTIVRPDYQNIDPLYFGYCLKSRQKDIESLGEGSTGQTELSRVLLGDIEIEILEEFKEQKVVANFFKAIDDKIELNQKMNETLEGIAKTLFKSWFIDFDPVRAKAEGRPTGLSKEIGDLFPDSFEDSELGEIPKGWTTESISEIVNIEYGKNLPTKKLLDEGFPVFGGNGVIGYFNEYLYEDVMTVIACRGAASGKVLRTLPKSFVTNNSLVLNHSQTNFCYQSYVDLYFRSIDLSIFVTGSAQPQLTIDNLSYLKMIIPSLEILELFQDQAGLLLQKIILNDDSSTNLKNLRDTLLPRLISGELKISDTENLIEEAGI